MPPTSAPGPLSRRAAEMPASPIRRLAPLVAAARAGGITVHALNIGQPDIPTPRAILDRVKSYDARFLPYGPSQGLPELIEALRHYYATTGVSLSNEEIFVTTSGSEAIFFTLAAIADEGDEVVVFEPFYTNYNGFARMAGVRLVPVATHPEDGYHLPSRAAIESVIGPRARGLLICSPNNPTGTVYTDDELRMLASICRDRGIWLVADEVYREFVYDGRTTRSALTLSERGDPLFERIVVVDSLSKRYSLCGARIGNIACRNRDFLDAILRFGQARLCPPTLEQYICCGLVDVPKSYTEEVIAEYQRRRDIVYAALAPLPGVVVRRPEGAFYLCARLPVADSNEFAEYLLSDFQMEGETVALAPADGFYATPGMGRDEVRIAYVLEESRLDRAMRIVARALTSFTDRS